MNESWRVFLQSQNAVADESGAVSFPSEPATADCFLCDLSHLGLIEVRGADASNFLQGQFTNDIRDVTPDRSQLSTYCTAKGRMLASFRIFRRGGCFFLRLPRKMLGPTLQRLSMFVLRSQVTLEDVSDKYAAIGLAGVCADDLVERTGAVPAREPGAVATSGDLTVLRIPGPSARFELIGPPVRMQELWQQLSPSATPVNARRWSWMDIRSGIPTVLPETVEAFVPQMANLQCIGGVSFTKGCYSGQEVIARSEYLGKLKRRMYLAHVPAANAPRPGDELYSPLAEAGHSAGRVLNVQAAPGGGFDLLAVLQIGAANADAVYLQEGGAKLALLDLPYPVAGEGDPQAAG